MRERDARVSELLDAERLDAAALDANLRDIRRINALLGWTRFTVRSVARLVADAPTFALLDLASGSADMPLAVARWASRHAKDARIVATDINPQIVAIAREQVARSGAAGVAVERRDALALPYADGAFDIALCTLALHHFEPEAAVRLLREMGRVSRRALVFDVERSWLAYALVIALTQATRMNFMTRHDAPASVRRAYTAPELRALAARAGLRDARVWVGFPFRLALEARGAA